MKTSKLTLATSLAGALALYSTAATQPAQAQQEAKRLPNFDSNVRCYGISKAGENDCAHIDGSHSCAGQSTLDFDSGEWKIVSFGRCLDLKGSPNQAFRVRLASGQWGYGSNPHHQ